MIWGFYLLGARRPKCGSNEAGENGGRKSRAWLALVVPCPVCASVVLLSASCLTLYFPGEAAVSVASLYAGFLALAGVSGFATFSAKTEKKGEESSLGIAMILVSSYFVISALVIPQFSEAGRIYRMADYSRSDSGTDMRTQLSAFAVLFALFAAGFLAKKVTAVRNKRHE
jgi:predicted transporter